MCLTIDERNTVFRTIREARPGKTAPASIADKVPIGRAGGTSSAYRRQNRQRGRIFDKDLFDIFSQRLHLIIILLNIYAQQCHDPVPDHCPFLIDAATIGNTFLRNNGKRNLIGILLQGIIEELLENLGLYPALNQCVLIIQFKH